MKEGPKTRVSSVIVFKIDPPFREKSHFLEEKNSLLVDLHGRGIRLLVVLEGKGASLIVDIGGRKQDCV